MKKGLEQFFLSPPSFSCHLDVEQVSRISEFIEEIRNGVYGYLNHLSFWTLRMLTEIIADTKLLVIIYILLKTRQTFLCAPLKTEIRVHSTAKKLVRGLTSEPIAPLLTILVNWLNTPRKFRDSLAGVFDSMYEEVRQKRGAYS